MEEVKAEENKVDGAFEDFIKSMPESLEDSQENISNEDQFIQESFFKSVMKRLSALEESAVFTKSFLKNQRRDITLFLERLEDEQMRLLISFLNDEWMEYVVD